jgi:broad specificity phosphatase PhoE
MATLYLIRHGQASFGRENYDELSGKGWQQGRALGRWLSGKVEPGAVFGGNLRRHRETVEALAAGFTGTLPTMRAVGGLDEFDHNAVIQGFRPEWADRTVMARDLESSSHPMRAFQDVFVRALERWAGGEYDDDYKETWAGFRERVAGALDEVLEFADGADVLVVTSGGPIVVALQSLLALSDRHTLGLNEVIANTSVTRVLYSGSRRSLAVFNNYSHLEVEDQGLVTFR